MLPLKQGDVAFIPAGPEYPHQIINTSDAPLKYLSVSTQEAPEICEYPDSGKFLEQFAQDPRDSEKLRAAEPPLAIRAEKDWCGELTPKGYAFLAFGH